ncbi:2-dehydropantoate 2-reductase [Variovorax sp. PBL-H6]|uniref:ketopantoate reductase family protein n=1 Tax=Variovorax sp. PBL-H6 TaxID=434009 RepID=UPI001315E59A|nr:2-dehydropantoate 2-reductase [Variovorax sp. PBL-H6]VTU34952.1 2-dehydropantoate 2-reductase [Variovorax sp. PBL-H6]
MRIAVMGAGAVGCYYGGMLARAGHSVVLIGRAQHVEAVRRDGLLLDTRSFQARVPLEASTEVDAVRDAGLVLFCVKSTDTESAAAAMRPYLAPDALVLTLQNGVDNATRLQAAVAQEVAATVVYVATEMAGPGHVKHHGRGELVIAPSARSAEIAELLIVAGVPTQVSDNVTGALWAKLILNCAYNAISAITQLPYGVLSRGEGVEAVMADVVRECLAVAEAGGVTVAGDTWAAVQRIAETMPSQFSSTAQDLARGKRSEIDHLNGYVLRQGEALGVATPVNRVLHTLVKLLEARDTATH